MNEHLSDNLILKDIKPKGSNILLNLTQQYS